MLCGVLHGKLEQRDIHAKGEHSLGGGRTVTETLCWKARDGESTFQLGLVKERSAIASGTLVMGSECLCL